MGIHIYKVTTLKFNFSYCRKKSHIVKLQNMFKIKSIGFLLNPYFCTITTFGFFGQTSLHSVIGTLTSCDSSFVSCRFMSFKTALSPRRLVINFCLGLFFFFKYYFNTVLHFQSLFKFIPSCCFLLGLVHGTKLLRWPEKIFNSLKLNLTF